MPCRFRVRYLLLPLTIGDGGGVGPIPIGHSAQHFYGVHVGEYDVMKFDFERSGKNITRALRTRATPHHAGIYASWDAVTSWGVVTGTRAAPTASRAPGRGCSAG